MWLCLERHNKAIKIEKEERALMNARELKAQMVRKDKSVDQLCMALGISRSAWFRKVGGESEFTQGEISGLRLELELDDHQTADIFFSQQVS
jgi:hypothetical protein